jgi:hypothetical protein
LRCRESLGTAPIRRSLKQADPDAAQHVFGQADLLQLNNITLDHRQNIPAAGHLLAPDDNFGLGGQLLQMDKVLWFGITGFFKQNLPDMPDMGLPGCGGIGGSVAERGHLLMSANNSLNEPSSGHNDS